MNFRSFRFKLMAATLAALLVMFGLLVLQTWLLLDDELRANLKDRVDRTNTFLVAAVALPMAQRDYATLGDVLLEAVASNALEYAVILDHRQRRIAAAQWAEREPLPPVTTGLDTVRGASVHVRRPITLAGETLGEVQYGLSLRFFERARDELAARMLRIGIVGLLVGMVLLAPLALRLSRRLGLLEAAAQELAAGNLNRRIKLAGDDELARLAGDFNRMADSLSTMITDLRKSEERFHLAVRGSSDGIWDWDVERGDYFFSSRQKEMLGYRDDELANDRQTAEMLVHPDDRPRLADALRAHFVEHKPFDVELRLRHKDGHYLWCRTRGQSVRNGEGRVVRLSGATTDTTDRKAAEAALQRLAHYDPLTQLPNRSLLADRLTMALAQARRLNGRLAVGLIDLDGFKPVNDTWGHEAGDRILIEVARRLRKAVREGDTVSRLGGDEFVVVLSGRASPADYESALTRMLALIAEPYAVAGTTVALSASIGVTFFPEDEADPDTLLRHADRAMYAAKQAGHNRWQVFDGAAASR